MNKRIQVNFFCKSNHWSRRMIKIRKIAKEYFRVFAMQLETMFHKISPEIFEKLTEEGLFTQFMTIYKFWLRDTSSDFEKTDAFIEKSVKLAIDLTNVPALDSIMDYGKFVLGEFKKRL